MKQVVYGKKKCLTIWVIRGLFKKYWDSWISAGCEYSILDFLVLLNSYICPLLTLKNQPFWMLCKFLTAVLLGWVVTRLRFPQNRSKHLYVIFCEKRNEVPGRISNVDCGTWWSYLGQKRWFSVVNKVLRGPRRCERQNNVPWRFYSQFSSIREAWCTKISYQMVVRRITNITFKLRAVWAKKSAKTEEQKFAYATC